MAKPWLLALKENSTLEPSWLWLRLKGSLIRSAQNKLGPQGSEIKTTFLALNGKLSEPSQRGVRPRSPRTQKLDVNRNLYAN